MTNICLISISFTKLFYSNLFFHIPCIEINTLILILVCWIYLMKHLDLNIYIKIIQCIYNSNQN
jgi:hypothetical protein